MNQEALAAAIGVKQAAVSAWELGGNMRKANIKTFEQKLKIRPIWLEYGEGEMFADGYKPNVVNEPAAKYSNVYSNEHVAERLGAVLNDYMLKHNMRRRHVCEQWDLNETHVSNVINGHKEISMGIIQAALQKGNVNINYLLGGKGPMYEQDYGSASVEKLVNMLAEKDKRISELEYMAGIKKRA